MRHRSGKRADRLASHAHRSHPPCSGPASQALNLQPPSHRHLVRLKLPNFSRNDLEIGPSQPGCVQNQPRFSRARGDYNSEAPHQAPAPLTSHRHTLGTGGPRVESVNRHRLRRAALAEALALRLRGGACGGRPGRRHVSWLRVLQGPV